MTMSVVTRRREMDSIVSALLHVIDGPDREEGARLTRRLVERLASGASDARRPVVEAATSPPPPES